MIEILSGSLPPYLGFNPFIYTKISASLKAYGDNFPFLTFWVQSSNKSPTALICKQDDTVFVTATLEADFEELLEFLSVIGYSSLQTERDTASRLGLKGEVYALLEFTNPNPCYTPNFKEASVKKVYEILFSSQNKDITTTEFEGFYADLSHRIRHGTALAEITENASAAVASHIYKGSAVISGVATLKEKRGQELARITLTRLIKHLPQNIYTASKDAAQFYLKLGFKTIGEITVIN